MDYPSFSIVIPTFQRREIVCDVLRSLTALDHQGNVEIIIVIDGSTDGTKLDPRVFISLGSIKLWTGSRPHFFKRLLQRGNLGLNFPTASALVWTAWARLEPRSLRAFLRALLRIRNFRASLVIRSDEPIEWLGGKGQVIHSPPPRHDVYVLPTQRPAMRPAPAPQMTRRASSE
jgi:hypothetical protein